VSVSELAPYERLAELAAREHALVAAFELARIGELVALAQERTTLVERLPARPPAAAGPALARAAALQQRTTALLERVCRDAGRELAELDRARRAARGYGMGLAVGGPVPAVDHAG
jgi:hypothetical protein